MVTAAVNANTGALMETLRQEVAHHLVATGSQRGADGHFALTCLGAHEKQIRHVGACNEQYEPHRAQQNPERLLDSSNHVFLQWLHQGSESCVVEDAGDHVA